MRTVQEKRWAEEDRKFLDFVNVCGVILPVGFMGRRYGGRMMGTVWDKIDDLLEKVLVEGAGITPLQQLVDAIQLLAGEVKTMTDVVWHDTDQSTPQPRATGSRARGDTFLAAIREYVEEANKASEERRAHIAAFGILCLLDGSGENIPGLSNYKVFEADDDGFLRQVSFSHHDL